MILSETVKLATFCPYTSIEMLTVLYFQSFFFLLSVIVLYLVDILSIINSSSHQGYYLFSHLHTTDSVALTHNFSLFRDVNYF